MIRPKAGKDKVILRPIEEPSITPGGIIVPDRAKKKVNQGIVISIGSLLPKDEIEIGDHVLFNAFSGNKVVLESGTFIILSYASIECVLEESGARLIDTETVKRVIRERVSEIRTKWLEGDAHTLNKIERDIIDRIDNIHISEGLEF